MRSVAQGSSPRAASSARCSQWPLRYVQVRPVPLYSLAPHAVPQTAAASSGPLSPSAQRPPRRAVWLPPPRGSLARSRLRSGACRVRWRGVVAGGAPQVRAGPRQRCVPSQPPSWPSQGPLFLPPLRGGKCVLLAQDRSRVRCMSGEVAGRGGWWCASGRAGPCRSLRSEPVADSCRPAHWGRSSSCLCIEARRGLLDRSIERAGWWSWLARSASGVTVVRAWVRSIDMGCPPRDLPQARSPAELRCRSTRAHTQSSWRAIVAAIATSHCLCNNPHARNHSSPHHTPDHTPEHREAPGAAFSLPRTYVSESRHAQL